jgi:hypothetical protein
VVPGEALQADPDLGGEVDAREGDEQHGAGRFAAERRVRERQRSGRDGGSEWHDAAAGLDL